jgi:NAD(P)-dependent dehydrogenase (short-subunit alcohol dehydrogenase family)
MRSRALDVRLPQGEASRFARFPGLLAVVVSGAVLFGGSLSAQAAPRPGQRVALVTGSTGGLGREVALRLGAMGMHVIVHGRDEGRGAEVVQEVERAGGTARFYRADFGSFAEVRALGEAILRDYDRIHVLVNNAGFGRAPDERLVTQDGLELRLQVNHLAHFLLTRMLLPTIVASAPGRIVNVASGAQNPIDFSDVMLEQEFDGGRAYGQSKLAQIMFTFDLAEELAGTGVLVNALHPATFMDTAMVQRAGIEPQSTVDEGAEPVMNLITNPEVGTGGYFNQTRQARAHAQAYDMDARRRLWELSEELTGVR